MHVEMYLYNENEFCLVKAFTISMSNNLEHIGLLWDALFFIFLDCIFLPPRTGPASGSSVKVLFAAWLLGWLMRLALRRLVTGW